MEQIQLTVQEMARLKGISVQRVRDLCNQKRIKAKKFGRDWMILSLDVIKPPKPRKKGGMK